MQKCISPILREKRKVFIKTFFLCFWFTLINTSSGPGKSRKPNSSRIPVALTWVGRRSSKTRFLFSLNICILVHGMDIVDWQKRKASELTGRRSPFKREREREKVLEIFGKKKRRKKGCNWNMIFPCLLLFFFPSAACHGCILLSSSSFYLSVRPRADVNHMHACM